MVASDSEVPTTGGVKQTLVVLKRITISFSRWSLNFFVRDARVEQLQSHHIPFHPQTFDGPTDIILVACVPADRYTRSGALST